VIAVRIGKTRIVTMAGIELAIAKIIARNEINIDGNQQMQMPYN
jgi:hypothetical protein